MNKIKQLRSTTERKFEVFTTEFTWLQELRVELLSTGPRLPGVLPGADCRVVSLLRFASSCGSPAQTDSFYYKYSTVWLVIQYSEL